MKRIPVLILGLIAAPVAAGTPARAAPDRPYYAIVTPDSPANAAIINAAIQAAGAGSAQVAREVQIAPCGKIYVGATIDNNVPRVLGPTLAGSCPTGAQVGGYTAGSFTLAATCSAGTVVMNFSTTAPNGWACKVQDMTTPAAALTQTAYTQTSTTISGTAASADQTTFLCEAF